MIIRLLATNEGQEETERRGRKKERKKERKQNGDQFDKITFCADFACSSGRSNKLDEEEERGKIINLTRRVVICYVDSIIGAEVFCSVEFVTVVDGAIDEV